MEFRKWLESVPAEFIHDGMVTLYRFSKTPKGDTYLTDPNKAKPSAYSRREFQTASTPRTFWYLDPSSKERMIGNYLYTAEIEADKIYDLRLDPEGFKSVLPDFDAAFNLIKNAGYDGCCYKPPQGDIVVLFVPLLAYKATTQTTQDASSPTVIPVGQNARHMPSDRTRGSEVLAGR